MRSRESFPELPDALAGLPQDAILDGEIVAWEDPGRARPFSVLQQRLGRKKVSEQMLREVPVAYLVFDVLYAGGELLIDRPLRERARILDELLAAERKIVHHRGHRGTQRKTGSQGEVHIRDERQEVLAQLTSSARRCFARLRRRNWKNCSRRRRHEAMKA